MLGALAAIGAAAATAAPAEAATPAQIYRDLAQNGGQTRSYSGADVRAALKNASVQGYGNPIVVVTLKPAVETQRPATGVAGAQATKTQGVAGAQKTVVRRPPLASTGMRSGTLPFTGRQLTGFAFMGLLLLGSGLLLRAAGRERTNRYRP
jgi:hypothetical protein